MLWGVDNVELHPSFGCKLTGNSNTYLPFFAA